MMNVVVDVNIRSIIAFREIGRGLSHIETFHRIMNMSPSYSVKDVLPTLHRTHERVHGYSRSQH